LLTAFFRLNKTKTLKKHGISCLKGTHPVKVNNTQKNNYNYETLIIYIKKERKTEKRKNAISVKKGKKTSLPKSSLYQKNLNFILVLSTNQKGLCIEITVKKHMYGQRLMIPCLLLTSSGFFCLSNGRNKNKGR